MKTSFAQNTQFQNPANLISIAPCWRMILENEYRRRCQGLFSASLSKEMNNILKDEKYLKHCGANSYLKSDMKLFYGSE
jgi:hypothetical protein